jgi:hypothetical protein
MTVKVRRRLLRNKTPLMLLAFVLSAAAASIVGAGEHGVTAQGENALTAEDRRPELGDCEQGVATNCLLLKMQEQVTTVIDRDANLLCSRGRVGPVGGTTCIAADAQEPALMVVTDAQTGRVLLAALDPQERLGGIMADEVFFAGQSQRGNLAVSVVLPDMPDEVTFLTTDGQDIGVEYPLELADEKREQMDRIRNLPIETGNGG